VALKSTQVEEAKWREHIDDLERSEWESLQAGHNAAVSTNALNREEYRARVRVDRSQREAWGLLGIQVLQMMEYCHRLHNRAAEEDEWAHLGQANTHGIHRAQVAEHHVRWLRRSEAIYAGTRRGMVKEEARAWQRLGTNWQLRKVLGKEFDTQDAERGAIEVEQSVAWEQIWDRQVSQLEVVRDLLEQRQYLVEDEDVDRTLIESLEVKGLEAFHRQVCEDVENAQRCSGEQFEAELRARVEIYIRHELRCLKAKLHSFELLVGDVEYEHRASLLRIQAEEESEWAHRLQTLHQGLARTQLKDLEWGEEKDRFALLRMEREARKSFSQVREQEWHMVELQVTLLQGLMDEESLARIAIVQDNQRGVKWILRCNAAQELEREYRLQLAADEDLAWASLRELSSALLDPMLSRSMLHCRGCEQEVRVFLEKQEIAGRLRWEQEFFRSQNLKNCPTMAFQRGMETLPVLDPYKGY